MALPGFTCGFSSSPLADNAALSLDRRKASRRRRRKQHEAQELGAFVRRMFGALVRRAADGDLQAVEVLAELDRASAEAPRRAGDAAWRFGYSYTEVGDALGISRQGARQRFASRR